MRDYSIKECLFAKKRTRSYQRKGYKLQPALGVSKEVFNDLKSHARKGLTLFKFNMKETFRQQELRKRQAMFPHMLEEFPELLTKQRYPRLWVIDVLTKYCFDNRRAYQLKKARSRGTGTKIRNTCNRSLSPPPSAQRPPALFTPGDEEEDPESESEDEKLLQAMLKLLKKKPKYASRLGLKRKAVSTRDEDGEDEEPPRAQRRLATMGSVSQGEDEN
ncbi:hypothetical protein EST38_g14602 [Candolleomyces aberdarensis]|uniref:Uncharacterized protein n=1 Tax=Candolleomyces aberdarensis TaxID=2316362 RepID=A0A4Q2CWY5_9AGAR|nr:hypothetical protein EST38_g14602 [Candolleomyces aberdarensis]